MTDASIIINISICLALLIKVCIKHTTYKAEMTNVDHNRRKAYKYE